MALFMIHTGEDERLKLRSFSARTKGAVATITITVETTDTWALGQTLKELDEVQKGQASLARAKRAAKPQPTKRLALPAPQLALPAPEDDQ